MIFNFLKNIKEISFAILFAFGVFFGLCASNEKNRKIKELENDAKYYRETARRINKIDNTDINIIDRILRKRSAK